MPYFEPIYEVHCNIIWYTDHNFVNKLKSEMFENKNLANLDHIKTLTRHAKMLSARSLVFIIKFRLSLKWLISLKQLNISLIYETHVYLYNTAVYRKNMWTSLWDYFSLYTSIWIIYYLNYRWQIVYLL
jgi:hypothetical protein